MHGLLRLASGLRLGFTIAAACGGDEGDAFGCRSTGGGSKNRKVCA